MSDRELFQALPLQDPWTDAKLPTLFLYLLENHKLTIPYSWHDPVMQLKEELKDFVARLHTKSQTNSS